MSFLAIKLPFLSLKPSVKISQQRIVIGTSPLLKVLTLFFDWNRVELDLDRHQIYFESHLGYFFGKKYQVDFNETYYLEYDYNSMTTSYGIFMQPLDCVENFKIYLVTKDRQRHYITSYRGEGAINHGWRGLLYGDSMFDYQGTQEEDSLTLVDLLLRVWQIPIGEPVLNRDFFKKRF